MLDRLIKSWFYFKVMFEAEENFFEYEDYETLRNCESYLNFMTNEI
jgi:hypothetical protein